MSTSYTIDGMVEGSGGDAVMTNAIAASAAAAASATATSRHDDDGLKLDAPPLPPPLPTMTTATAMTTNHTTDEDAIVWNGQKKKRKYHAVRVGRCSLSSSSSSSSSFSSSSSPPGGGSRDNVVTIRNAIFVRWEDARAFVECEKNDVGVEYSSFDDLEDAERYLLMEDLGEGGAGAAIEDGKNAGETREEGGGSGATTGHAGVMMTNDGSSGMRDIGVLIGDLAEENERLRRRAEEHLAEENELLRRRAEELLFASGASRNGPSTAAGGGGVVDAAAGANANATANNDRAMMTNATNDASAMNSYLAGKNERLRRRAENLAAFACNVMSMAGVGGGGLVNGVAGHVGGGGGGGIDEAHAAAIYRYWSEKMAAAEAIGGMNLGAVSIFGRQPHQNDAFASTMMTNALVNADIGATIGQTPLGAKSRRKGGTTRNDEAVVGTGDGVVSFGEYKRQRKRKANDQGGESPVSMVDGGSADPRMSSKKKSKKRADIWCELLSLARFLTRVCIFIVSHQLP